MPTTDIYTDRERVTALAKILPGLRGFLAKELSCNSISLNPLEISLKILVPESSLRIADTEIETKAHSFPERVDRQDEICRNIREYVKNNCSGAGSVYAWLQLSELGHST